MSVNGPMMESKHHLPECYQAQPATFDYEGDCICDRLRAAEQRGYSRAWSLSAQEIEQQALAAAREAVAAHIRADITTQHMFSGRKDRILAAIDALRGES